MLRCRAAIAFSLTAPRCFIFAADIADLRHAVADILRFHDYLLVTLPICLLLLRDDMPYLFFHYALYALPLRH